MWELINYKTEYKDNGCEVKDYDYYQLQNLETKETQWVDEYDYYKFKRLGLIAVN